MSSRWTCSARCPSNVDAYNRSHTRFGPKVIDSPPPWVSAPTADLPREVLWPLQLGLGPRALDAYNILKYIADNLSPPYLGGSRCLLWFCTMGHAGGATSMAWDDDQLSAYAHC